MIDNTNTNNNQVPQTSYTEAGQYFSNGEFFNDIAAQNNSRILKTGFANLDNIQQLCPGLYVLGAVPSLGKTTFALQLADNLASAGTTVLFFSLEQGRFEILSKSISRGFFLYNQHQQSIGQSACPLPSSLEIRNGIASNYSEFQYIIDQYTKIIGNNMVVIDGNFQMTIENIESVIKSAINQGVTPVVIIDYLQIITPSLQNGKVMDIKASIDRIVHRLKVLQTTYSLTVILVSSINRANYVYSIDFESFKESGSVEYTADVVWGLQLSVLTSDLFNREKSLSKKREIISNSKAQIPRKVDLVCLKNRFGVASYSLTFDYYSNSDIFLPAATALTIPAQTII